MTLWDYKKIELYSNKKDILFNHEEVGLFLTMALDLVYPGNLRKTFHTPESFSDYQKETTALLEKILLGLNTEPSKTKTLLSSFETALPSIANLIHSDARALYTSDPSVDNLAEVVLTFPGLEAISTYRIAHFFYDAKIPILPRALSEVAHSKTGIDIHPGATIGESFFIDHGTGVVIGETAIIGKNVKIYQGVTLGALHVDKSLAQTKRHPTVEDNCVLYSNATILGGNTTIGANSVIGGNVWLTQSIAPNSVVYHKSEVRCKTNTTEISSINTVNRDEEITYEI